MECEFSILYKSSELPADKDSGSFMGGKDCLRWKIDGAPFEEDFDIAKWLPVFVEGAQETTEPMRLIALTGSKQMIQADWRSHRPAHPRHRLRAAPGAEQQDAARDGGGAGHRAVPPDHAPGRVRRHDAVRRVQAHGALFRTSS
jgi:hypothetical protein